MNLNDFYIPRELIKKFLDQLSLSSLFRIQLVSKSFDQFVRTAEWENMTVKPPNMIVSQNLVNSYKFVKYDFNRTCNNFILQSLKNCHSIKLTGIYGIDGINLAMHTNLQKLSFNMFSFSKGTDITKTIGSLTYLKKLFINRVLDISIDNIIPLTNLRVLKFNCNTGSKFQIFNLNLQKLQIDYIDNNIICLTNLMNLDIYKHSNMTEDCLEKLPKLKIIKFGKQCDTIYLKNLTNLKKLTLFDCVNMRDTDIKNLTNLKKLVIKDSHFKLTDFCLMNLTNLKKLEIILGNISCDNIGKFTNLRSLKYNCSGNETYCEDWHEIKNISESSIEIAETINHLTPWNFYNKISNIKQHLEKLITLEKIYFS
jgi:hypothetical protein